MPVLLNAGPRLRVVYSLLAYSMMSAAAPAHAADRWTAHNPESRATFSIGDHGAVASGELSCKEQAWTMSLALTETLEAGEAEAELRIDGTPYSARARIDEKGVSLRVQRQLLEPLMGGLNLAISFKGDLRDKIDDFDVSLIGSRRAIRAAQAACSSLDMSDYEGIKFRSDAKGLALGRELRGADIEAFTYATTARPKVETARVDLEKDREIVFTRLCGSRWYYGASGCNITAFAQFPAEAVGESDQQEAVWRAVYDSENAQLFIDPEAGIDGLPDIVSFPTRMDDDPKIWRWDGAHYRFKAVFGEPEAVEPEPQETDTPVSVEMQPQSEPAEAKPAPAATADQPAPKSDPSGSAAVDEDDKKSEPAAAASKSDGDAFLENPAEELKEQPVPGETAAPTTEPADKARGDAVSDPDATGNPEPKEEAEPSASDPVTPLPDAEVEVPEEAEPSPQSTQG